MLKSLLWINAIAAVVYATFVAAILVADVWIFPKLNAVTAPPSQVGEAIRQATDIEGLREIALVLLDHVTDQAKTVDQMLKSMVFWTRLHFLFALGLASYNLVLLFRLRRELAKAGSNATSGR
jgi:hypothetical protein